MAKGLTQKAFAASLGIVQGYLSGLEQGKKTPSRALLKALSHIHGVQEEWLFGGNAAQVDVTGRTTSASPPPPQGIPLLARMPENFPDTIDPDDIRDYIQLPGIGKNCFAIPAEGSFMAPTILDGDLLIFKPGGEIGNRSIVLMTNKWGEVILRRCRMKGGEVYFSPENPAYIPFKASSETRIFGTVVSIWRNVKV